MDWFPYDRNLRHERVKLLLNFTLSTAQKIKFSIKNFFSKYDQICKKLQTWSHLLKKFLMENFITCEVDDVQSETMLIFFSVQKIISIIEVADKKIKCSLYIFSFVCRLNLL